jgi:hypothetical protein
MTAKPKRRRGAQPLSSLIPRAARAALRKHGFAKTEIVSRWPLIVGRGLAAHCAPERLAYAANQPGGGTLHLRAEGGFALELQHLEPMILERINTYYGYRAVARLVIKQGPLPARRAPRRRKTVRLTPAQERALAKTLAATRDEDLRQALADLGRQVFADEKDANNK